MASSANIRAGAAYVELVLENNQFLRGLKMARARLLGFSKAITAVGKRLLTMGAVMSLPFIGGTKVFADFEEQMANVSTMLDEPAKHMDRFRQGIRDMSIDFGEGTDTLAKGLYDILSASIPAEHALDVLRVSAKAAKAGITDTGVAADAITTILNAYGLSASRAGDVSDLLFGIVKRGKTTFAELAPSIGLVATTAASAGVSLDELGAIIATMTRNGVRTENAITALNAIIGTFLNPTDDAAKYARKLGFELSSVTLKSIGLKGVFEKISKLPPDAISKLFPNKRAIRGILPALKNMKGFGTDMKVMNERAGLTEVAYQKMANTLSMAMARVKQGLIGVLSVIGEALAPTVKKASKLALAYIKQIIAWIKQNKKLVVTAAKIVGVIIAAGAGLIVLGAALKIAAVAIGVVIIVTKALIITFTIATHAAGFLLAAIGLLKVGLLALGGLLGALFAPAMLVKLAIVAIVVYILYATGVIGKVVSYLKEKFAQIAAFAVQAFKGIRDALAAGDLMLAVKIFWQTLKVGWLAGINELKKLWVGFKSWYQTTTAEIFYGAISIITDSWASLKTTWTNTVSFLLDVWNIFIKNLKTAWNASQSFLQKRWLDLMGLFDSSLDVDAAKKLVDAEAKMLEKEAQDELDNALKNSAAQTNKDKAAIEKERKDKQSMIEQQMGEDMKGIETENAEAMRESQKALKKAKEEWKKSIEEAKSKREASGTGDQSKISNIKDILKGVAPQLDSVKGKVEVAGSFYATSLLSLSAGGAAERTAKATEDIKKNTKKTNQILEKQSGDLTYE